ncbi:hypothetical protein [Cupriavidus pampae]|nr:hypothetical protein [Cupriavidus pampae]
MAIGVAVRVLKLDPSRAADMHAWHTHTDHADASPPDALVGDGRALAFALIGIATHRPQFLIGALAALSVLPLLILSKLL